MILDLTPSPIFRIRIEKDIYRPGLKAARVCSCDGRAGLYPRGKLDIVRHPK